MLLILMFSYSHSSCAVRLLPSYIYSPSTSFLSVTFYCRQSDQNSKMTSDNNAEIPLVTDITLDDIAAGLDSGRFTSVQLVKTFLARIKEVDHIFHSVIETNPDALRIAQELDEERSSLQKRRR